MIFRDRYLVVSEQDYDGVSDVSFALDQFPYPADLAEVKISKMPNDKASRLKMNVGKCYENTLRISKYDNSYNIVFCYYGIDSKLKPHAIVERSGKYHEVSPKAADGGAIYYRYATLTYQAFLAEMRAQLRPDFDPEKHEFYPISVDTKGRFVFVKD